MTQTKVLDGAADARNEDYRTKTGLTPEQSRYDDLWLRLRQIYSGRTRRPWITIGFKRRPVRENHDGRTMFVTKPLTKDRRFYFPEELDVLTLSDIPANSLHKRARHTRFHAMVLGGYTDENGRACVGGHDRFCSRQFDFAKPPIQDHPLFNSVAEVDRRRLKATRAGTYRIVTSPRWIDLCVGDNPDDGAPCVLYRLPNTPATLENVKCTKAPKEVKVDSLLATVKEPSPFFTARFTNGGEPVIDRVGMDVLSATRAVDLFKLFNCMHELSADMTLLEGKARPPVVPMDEWLPPIWYQLEGAKRPKLRDALIHEALCKALGPRGDFRVKAPCCGEIQALQPIVGQEHLVELVIKYDPSIALPPGYRAPAATTLIDGAVRLQIPASAVLRVEPGQLVTVGQAVADYCKRIVFDTWTTVEAVIGEETAMLVLDDFIEQIPVQPGFEGWEGPGRLWPAELLAEVPRGARWVWDVQPALPYLNEDGMIVGPAIKQQNWNDFTFGGGRTAYFNLTPAGNLLTGDKPQRPSQQDRRAAPKPGDRATDSAEKAPPKKRGRRDRNRKRAADCVMTRSAEAAGLDADALVDENAIKDALAEEAAVIEDELVAEIEKSDRAPIEVDAGIS